MASDPQRRFSVRLAAWSRDADALRAIRHAVFVVEQHVPEALEWDGIDAGCAHAIAEDAASMPIGCGRLLRDGHIGRMAVLRECRGRGVGAALLALLVALARERGNDRAILNAQTHALPFYARFGFMPEGLEFTEAGIPHRTMTLTLR
ncbi:MAG: GNAT family N-acetyltransferase [Betaproteobacteria bacterium]|nr:GNAT family N-acetyltransferase [Betaproteobacteria bacterium]HEV8184404.1 GNAT family N-acetyltransferase [Chthoniobacterales bacterium]